jgi:hypothetical protein
LWDNIPALVRQLRQYTRHDIPLYVRTGDAWDAWSDALRSEAPGPAHAVVRGRKPSHTEPPGRRYAMVYDDLDMLDDDRHEPSMEPVIRAADGRFVVTADGDDVPDGFVPLELSMPGASEGGSEEG